VALQLWRSGVVERVVVEGRSHKVFLRRPENLLHVEQVHRTLADIPEVMSVTSLMTYLKGTAR
jgi:predicted RND superfamily exporter protein